MDSSAVSNSDEREPLLPTVETRPKASRNVKFSANPVTRTIEPETRIVASKPSSIAVGVPSGATAGSGAAPHHGTASATGPPVLAALNSKLRRRNSHTAVPMLLGGAAATGLPPTPGAKLGPQRSTKKTEKLKLLPNPERDEDDDGADEESGREVYSQYTRIKDPNARRDAARLGKSDRAKLPRVTAYCTANRYDMDGLMRFLKGRGKSRGAHPKLIDECIYTPYAYAKEAPAPPPPKSRRDPVMSYQRRHSTGGTDDTLFAASLATSDRHDSGYGDEFTPAAESEHHDGVPTDQILEEDLLGASVNNISGRDAVPDFDTQVHTPEVFLFDYGVVVIWGMSENEEARFLKYISKFELEKLAPDDVETEQFNFYYTKEYQARIYNDFITLRDKNNYMTKLAISHALAQSVKTSLFEELISSTIETCKDIPTQIALTGKIALSRSQINMQIGELFILRINIHLNGSVLDTPELFWVEPQLEPVYQAVRSYLEMDQRVGLLTERLDVIADLLAVLKDQLSHGHGEKLEWIVIVLIAMEIVVAGINIIVDLYAGE
ncbi:sporulation protein RMD1 [Cordyceps fumosorosea ARSEF 2679]|uniref:Sporulation protein RMD1 n=1 Tax=Cordyceps fumosorosea (strain ARSEF 2679) TaxID=1081104 RepID=A0A167ZFG6_CORFA|nr:sporulation protein RMD1 [Cordyceps fumosorosea ARSEF 2679]OAA67453.1 sporulation protein RMD1 [Cordyceps fumosorosea ARSEF 2679]